MSKLRLKNLQVKLLVLVLIAAMPTFLLLFLMAVQERQDAIRAAKADLANVAHLLSLNRERHLEGAQQVLRTIAVTPRLREGNATFCSEYLRDLLGRVSVYFNFGVFNTDGTLRCSALTIPSRANVADREFFRNARDRLDFSVSDYTLGRFTKRKTLQFGYPLFDAAEPQRLNGVVFASLDLEDHERSLAAVAPQNAARLVFTDNRGVILSSYPPMPSQIGAKLQEPALLAAIADGGKQLVEDVRARERSYLHAVDVVRVGNQTAMRTVLSMPLDAVLAPVNQKLYRVLGAFAAAVMAAMLIAWRLGDVWVSRRTALISTAARRIAGGDREVRTGLSASGDEIDQIGRAFDDMVSALERREQDILVTNRRLEASQRIAHLGTWELDVTTQRCWWSAQTYDLFALPPGIDTFDGFLEWVHPEDRDRVAFSHARFLAGKLAVDHEFRVIGTDGRTRWVHAVADCITDRYGNVIKFSGILQDLTERKATDSALLASEERYRQLFRMNPLPIAMFDPVSLRFTAANDAFCRQYGYTEDELLGLCITDLNPSENHKPLIAEVRTLEPGVTTAKGVRNIRKDGVILEVEATRQATEINGRPVVITSPLDVTERVRAEMALSASEERYRLLFESNPLPLWVYDVETLAFLDVNAAACRSYGYSHEEFLAMTIRDIRPPEDWAALEQSLTADQEVISSTGPWRHQRKDGSVLFVEINSHQISLRGRAARFVCPLDVTERLRAEESTRKFVDRLQALRQLDLAILESRSSADVAGTALLHLQRLVPYWGASVRVFDSAANKANALAMDRPPTSDYTAPWNMRLDEYGLDVLSAVKQGETWVMADSAAEKSPPASLAPLIAAGMRSCACIPLIVDGVLVGALNLFADRPDYFDRERLEVADYIAGQLAIALQQALLRERILQQSAELEEKVQERTAELARTLALQQTLFDSVPQIVWTTDLHGSVTYASRTWNDKIALTPDDWRGEAWAKALHPEDLERVGRGWQQAVATGTEHYVEYRLLHRDGEYHSYQVSARKVLDAEGAPVCWVGICTDVTEGHRREQALQAANRELEAFSYSVSHDLRGPLRVIDGFSSNLQLEYHDQLGEQGRHYLNRIRAGALTMSELIDDLLSLAQINRQEMSVMTVDLSAMAREVADQLRQLDRDRDVKVIVQDGLTAAGDPRLLRVALTNLIGNAWKFSSKRAAAEIEVGETARTGDMSMFFVRDNGAGFDSAYASKLFGVFQRLHSAREFPGTGIGLATVQRIIQRHGGHVSAESQIGQGATLYFSLRRTL